MGDTAKNLCRACQTLIPGESVFCDYCGAEQTPATEPSAVQKGAAAEVGGVRGASEQRAPDMIAVADSPSAPEQAGTPAACFTIRHEAHQDMPPPESIIGGRRESRCRDMQVLYNVARVFVEGLVMPFEFRLIPQQDEIEDVFIEVRCNRRIVARAELAEELESGFELPVALPFTPGTDLVGKVPFEIWIGYSVAGKPQHYIARKTHTCFRRTEPINNVMDQLKIELHNEVNAGHASDPVVNMKIDGLDRLMPGATGPAEDFRHIDIPDIWERICLTHGRFKPLQPLLRHRPVNAPAAHAKRDRFSLVGPAGRLHVIDCTEGSLGRNRRCCIVVCRLPWAGSPLDPANPNLMISGQHATIAWSGSGWGLRDGGCRTAEQAWRPSSHGLYLDGERLPRDGRSVVLPVDVPFRVSLVHNEEASSRTFSLRGRIWSPAALAMLQPSGAGCDEGDRGWPVLVLQHAQETYVFLRGRFALNALHPDWDGLCVCRSQGGFLLRGEHRCEWICPGLQVSVPAGRISAQDYLPGMKR